MTTRPEPNENAVPQRDPEPGRVAGPANPDDGGPDLASRNAVRSNAESPFVIVSRVLDANRADDVSEGEHRWQRVTKVCEESGEVWQALSGSTGHNLRKGRTHTLNDVRDELLDTASAALCAWTHLTDNEIDPLPALLEHIESISRRLERATEGKSERVSEDQEPDK